MEGRRTRVNERLAERQDVAVEADDVETIPGVEALQREAERLLRLLDLLPGHAARGVEDKQDVLGGNLLPGHLALRREHHQETTVLLAAAVGQHIQAELFLRDGVVKQKVLCLAAGVALGGHPGGVLIQPRHRDVERRRINRLERLRRVDGRANDDLLRDAAVRVLRHRIAILVNAGRERHHLRIGELDLLLTVRGDRKYARLEGAAAHVLQQRRIDRAPDILFVDPARFVPVEHLPLDRFLVDRHAELGDRRILRQREDVGPFQDAVRGIDKDLLDLGARGPGLQRDLDTMALHRKSRKTGQVRQRPGQNKPLSPRAGGKNEQ